jgi:uracil-DNA glycosylase
VVVCLGKIAFDGFLSHQLRGGQISSRAGLQFRHAAEYALAGGLILIASYHPSLQNTNTGKLTREMFLDVFKRARQAAGTD